MDICFDKLPQAMINLPQWVMWKYIDKGDGKATKVPFQTNGKPASSTNPATWNEFEQVKNCYEMSNQYTGIGFVFIEGGDMVGVDIDGCRNPETGEVAEWAKKIILSLDTYSEMSPSASGVKLFITGKSPLANGKKKALPDMQRYGDKEPAIEVYDRGRYFAVTGLRMRGPHEPQARQSQLQALCDEYFKQEATTTPYIGYQSETHVAERARKYLMMLPPSISGQGGHNAAFHAACVLVLGFGLDEGTSICLMREWNATCSPPWTDRELGHKIRQAMKQPGERNYLRNTPDNRIHTISVPSYRIATEKPKDNPQIITVADSARQYIAAMRAGATELIPMGIGDLDEAIGGGIAKGEYVAMAARPSHGKSMIAMQCVHQWAATGLSSFVVSAEMSALALGKRVLHFVSDIHERDWRSDLERLESEIAHYEQTSAKSYIVADCNSADHVCEQIEHAIENLEVKAVVVDYVQLLKAPGNSRTDQVSYTSRALKRIAKARNVPMLLLCQMSRAVERRDKFMPVMSDLEHSSQIEQDADVITFLCWPWKLDDTKPKNEYHIFIAKNRNREIKKHAVQCILQPNRQMIVPPPPQPRYEEFDKYNGEL